MTSAQDTKTPHGQTSFLRLASPVRRPLLLAGVLSGVGALSSVLPIIAVMELVRILAPLASYDGSTPASWSLVDTGRLWLAGGVLIGSLIAASLLTFAGYHVSHSADMTFSRYVRQRQVDQLLRLPLDWFHRNSSGKVKKIVQDDVAKTHQLIAHVVPDATGAVAGGIISVSYLFIVDWRIGVLGLLPVAAVAAAFPLMMKDLTRQFSRFSVAAAELNSATVELVRGIAPMKVFASHDRGGQRFRDRSANFVASLSDWVRSTMHGTALVQVFSAPSFAIAVSAVGSTMLVLYGGLDPLAAIPSVLL
ncbi:MAG: ABC transporter ATP-binding protein, partial [Rhodococcus sp.]|nr:ABC transporter ATP-binding protein [Rhodococcus sp. (in: high G+C Gram-positive bacteria)]